MAEINLSQVLAMIQGLQADVGQMQYQIVETLAAGANGGAGGNDHGDGGIIPSVGGGGAFALGSTTVGEDEVRAFVQCRFQWGRRIYSIEDQRCDEDMCYYLNIPTTAPASATVVGDTSWPQSDDDFTRIPLVQFKNDEILEDYRGMPVVPVWE